LAQKPCGGGNDGGERLKANMVQALNKSTLTSADLGCNKQLFY